jgi:hypothetical protein
MYDILYLYGSLQETKNMNTNQQHQQHPPVPPMYQNSGAQPVPRAVQQQQMMMPHQHQPIPHQHQPIPQQQIHYPVGQTPPPPPNHQHHISHLPHLPHLPHQQNHQQSSPGQPHPQQQHVHPSVVTKKLFNKKSLEDSMLVTQIPDEETVTGQVKNREAIQKIRDAWIFKQIRQRQPEFTQYRTVCTCIVYFILCIVYLPYRLYNCCTVRVVSPLVFDLLFYHSNRL